MTYTVRYRIKGKIFWRRLKRVKGDGFVKERNTRYFVLEDETLIHIPDDSEVQFSKERYFITMDKVRKESGH
ncbi:MAG: hypothetical protein BWX71_02240 [Deltaproteobacteria bacterium ADurb.Bin072]|nr:MAG: hypothetical protein BWX71_02240 [Deltaproteobacteria bacterium ADurb.Bin072]